MAYLVDSDVFIQAKNAHYGFDFCPAFWDWIVAAHADGKVFSVEKVGDELAAGANDLAKWANALGSSFLLQPDAAVVSSLALAVGWANSVGTYEPAAVTTFAASADLYLLAHAHAHHHTVVTHEVAANSPKRVKIPNACAGVGVNCVTPFEMLRAAGAKFIVSS